MSALRPAARSETLSSNPGRGPNLRNDAHSQLRALSFSACLHSSACFGAGLLARLCVHYHLSGSRRSSGSHRDPFHAGHRGNLLSLHLFRLPAHLSPALAQGILCRPAVARSDAFHFRGRLHFGAAAICFRAGLVNGYLMPGPSDTPIDRIFRTAGRGLDAVRLRRHTGAVF